MTLAFCHGNGIKPSDFDSWDSADRARILGYALYEASVCNECGTLHQEWTDENGVELKPGHEGITLSSRECPGCIILDVKLEQSEHKRATKYGFVDKE